MMHQHKKSLAPTKWPGAMLFLTIGIGIRSWGNLWGSYVGTAILGMAIAFGNVLIPAVIKNKFPQRAGTLTGLQTATMALGPCLAAGLSIPLVNRADL